MSPIKFIIYLLFLCLLYTIKMIIIITTRTTAAHSPFVRVLVSKTYELRDLRTCYLSWSCSVLDIRLLKYRNLLRAQPFFAAVLRDIPKDGCEGDYY